ncbi:MAG TPA: alpha/beta hydrolase, partial [Sphingorhabdus sp.]|nr:alpha/beta hydrolase [Sphingorhabdus sp.]
MLAVVGTASPALAQTERCYPGAYGADDGDYVAIAALSAKPEAGLRYLFRDGRRGFTTDKDAPIVCGSGYVEVRGASSSARWTEIAFTKTDTSFVSAGTQLSGQLIEPGGATNDRPLVVMVHGSERTPAIGSVYAYSLAAQGISVFVYDKRGTGGSEGEYTQNFNLLANDAAAALRHATALAKGRYSRAGYFGGS